MKINFAVRSVETFEARTPLGPKRVVVHTKIGEISEEVPDQVAKQIGDVPDFNTLDVIVEGLGVYLDEMPNGQVAPRTIQFRFPDEIKDKDSAFDNFNQYMNEAIQEREEHQRQAQEAYQKAQASKASQIVGATEMDLAAINEISRRGGIVEP